MSTKSRQIKKEFHKTSLKNERQEFENILIVLHVFEFLVFNPTF